MEEAVVKIYERDSDGDRQGQQCKCSQCRTVAICTRSFDFYSSVYSVDDKDLLVCDNCMHNIVSKRLRQI